MIPKIIHYCWFGDEPWDNARQERIDSWKEILEGYEFRKWDIDSISAEVSRNYRKMIGNKNWALARDFVRLYALNQYGGIYLDPDVEIIEPFSSVLYDPAFIGLGDNNEKLLDCNVMGAEPGHPFVSKCLSYYKNSLRPDASPAMSQVITEIAEKFFGYEMPYRGARVFRNGLTVYRADYISSLMHKPYRDNFTAPAKSQDHRTNYWLTGWTVTGNELALEMKKHWLDMSMDDWKFALRKLLGWRD